MTAQFRSVEWRRVAGRQWVAVDRPAEVTEPTDLLNAQVLIDGAAWLVTGVEKPTKPSLLGLVVERSSFRGFYSSTVYQEDGRCSACHRPAYRVPTGQWWHVGDACKERSAVVWPASAFNVPAEFEAAADDPPR